MKTPHNLNSKTSLSHFNISTIRTELPINVTKKSTGDYAEK